MAIRKGDIVLVQFPFSDLSQTKLHPALILAFNSILNEVTLCFISSRLVQTSSPDELVILKSDDEFHVTGLKVSSKIRVTKIMTIEQGLILRKLGKLSNKQTKKLNKTMIKAFQLQG